MADWHADRADWLAVPEALARILAAVRPLDVEAVPLPAALGRILGAAAVSPIDHPPWDNSAMDGFAVRAADIRGAAPDAPVALRVVDDVPAGGFPSRPIGPGTAAKIMTGAPVPDGADSVVRVEHTDAWPGHGDGDRDRSGAGRTVRVFRDDDAGRNIRRRGEDLRVGRTMLEPGRRIGAAEIGLLAATGHREVPVFRRPRVAILSNGDELVEIDRFDEVLAGRRIVDSNGYALAAAVAASGGEPVRLGIAHDDRDRLRGRIEAARGADALITTAGASVGEHDLMKEVLASLGYGLGFWRVRMKPGSPFSFGTLGGVPVFGLPGNPVSALVTFEVLVRPAIRRMLGRAAHHAPTRRVTAADRIPGVRDRVHFARVRLEPDGKGGALARLTGAQGSGILSSIAAADALLVVPEGVRAIEPGHTADAIPLRTDDDAAEDLGYSAVAP